MEVWVLREPRSGGHTRTFAGVPLLTWRPFHHRPPSSCKTCWSSTEQGSRTSLGQRRRDRIFAQIFRASIEQPAPQTPVEGAGCCGIQRAGLAAILQKEFTSVSSQGVGEANSVPGFGCLLNCFPGVWGLALQYMFCP